MLCFLRLFLVCFLHIDFCRLPPCQCKLVSPSAIRFGRRTRKPFAWRSPAQDFP